MHLTIKMKKTLSTPSHKFFIVHPFTHQFVHLFIFVFHFVWNQLNSVIIRLFIRSFIQSSVHSFIYSFIHSFIPQENADTEWKFARARMRLSYFNEIGCIPPPFNLIPLRWVSKFIWTKCCKCCNKPKTRRISKHEKAKDQEEKYKVWFSYVDFIWQGL